MSDNKTDSIAKEALKIFQKEPERASLQCLSDEELADYVSGVLSDEPQKEDIASHIAECDFCFSKTASCVSALAGFDRGIPDRGNPASIRKAKSIPKIYPKAKTKSNYMKRNRFLFIAAGFFILSFIYKRYFLQFLVAASIFGFKWVMDTGGSRALIMIYDAWQQKKGSRDEEEKKTLTRNRRI